MPIAPDPEAPDWPLWLAPAGMGLAIGVLLVVSFLVVGLMAAAGLDVAGRDRGAVNVVENLIQDASFVGAALFLADRAVPGRVRLASFGLRRTSVRAGFGWALTAIAAYFAFAFVWNAVVGPGGQQKNIFNELGVTQHGLAIALVGVLVCLVAPVAEEFFFRGFGYGVLAPRLGVLGAALVVGLVFGAVHLSSTPVKLLPELAFLGFALCLLRARTRSILPGIGVHATNNSIAYGVLVGWSWQIVPLALVVLVVLALALRPLSAPRAVAAGN